ncbi:hypothetical protein GCM10022403_080150 [Streptomyces coacervatus]|uniref:Transposase Helix-turn-helix domain-containing protein n=1 Tax=Streptomyces coacervatus TaxID=647381 RepID=A0ABP7J6M5_9ACTN|nr:transposase family protein [Streptomyces coacervatus]MDF2269394.1 transposase family protein [Streptomyces coacervatus]
MTVYHAARKLPHALVELVAMLIVTVDGDPNCRLRPHQRALVALAYLHKHETPAPLAAGFRISVGTTHAYVHDVVNLLARHAPTLAEAMREADPGFLLPDGPVTKSDKLNDGTTDYSGKKKCHGVNIQAVTAQDGGSCGSRPRGPAGPRPDRRPRTGHHRHLRSTGHRSPGRQGVCRSRGHGRSTEQGSSELRTPGQT